MSLRERIRNLRRKQNTELAKSKAAKSEADIVFEKARAEKEEELDKLTLVASKALLPFLKVVNDEEFNGHGEIVVLKKGPFLRGGGLSIYGLPQNVEEYSEPYVEAALDKSFGSTPASGMYESSSSGFTLRLRLYRTGHVEVMGANEHRVLSKIDLKDEESQQQLEEAIYSAATGNACIWHHGGRINLSRD